MGAVVTLFPAPASARPVTVEDLVQLTRAWAFVADAPGALDDHQRAMLAGLAARLLARDWSTTISDAERLVVAEVLAATAPAGAAGDLP
jgi:hypothetical protein